MLRQQIFVGCFLFNTAVIADDDPSIVELEKVQTMLGPLGCSGV